MATISYQELYAQKARRLCELVWAGTGNTSIVLSDTLRHLEIIVTVPLSKLDSLPLPTLPLYPSGNVVVQRLAFCRLLNDNGKQSIDSAFSTADCEGAANCIITGVNCDDKGPTKSKDACGTGLVHYIHHDTVKNLAKIASSISNSNKFDETDKSTFAEVRIVFLKSGNDLLTTESHCLV